jgi:hypothetical protein
MALPINTSQHCVSSERNNKPTPSESLNSPVINASEEFNVHESVHGKNILLYVQQDATLPSLFYLETALHVLGGTTTHHQERKQLYLQRLVFVTPLLLPAAIVEELEPV